MNKKEVKEIRPIHLTLHEEHHIKVGATPNEIFWAIFDVFALIFMTLALSTGIVSGHWLSIIIPAIFIILVLWSRLRKSH